MNSSIKLLFDYLRDTIYSPEHASLDVEKLPVEYRELGKGIQLFATYVQEISVLAKALSKGNLNVTLPSPENEMAAPLKALHAKLKHLAWQAKQVSLGDYQQRIDFMGEFAEAFNNMTEQLRNQRAALLEEIESGRRKTKAVEQSNSLLKAITSRISQWIIVVNAETLEWLYVNHQADKVDPHPI